MAISLNGSTQYLSVASSVLGSSPSAYTLSCRVNGAAQDGKVAMGFGRSSDNFPQILLMSGESGFGQSTSAVKLYIRNDATTIIHGDAAGDAAGTAFDSTWRHIAATYASGTVTVYVDGSSVFSEGSLTPGTITLDRTAIGARVRGAVTLFFTGAIARPTIYNAALSADEVGALSDGIAPDNVRPQSLVFYAPVVRNFQDLKGAVTITDNGPVTQSGSPRMYV